MSYAKKESPKCFVCDKRAYCHITEYNTGDKKNTVVWYCRAHKPPYDFKFRPPLGAIGYKKYVDLNGINNVLVCSEFGNTIT